MNPHKDVQQVLVITLLLNLLVATCKIAIGLGSGALAIVADGFHSLMDSGGNVVALIANRIASQPPDSDHPYGHHRFETLGALFISGLLLLTAWEVLQTIGGRLFGSTSPATITPLTLTVLVGTLVVNLFISTYQRRAGKRLRSALLLADAENTQADVFVTTSVLISGVLVMSGFALADTLAALFVVIMIARAAWKVFVSARDVLVDAAPYTPETLRDWAEEVPADFEVHRARSRGTADAAHIDIDLLVPPTMTAAQQTAITCAIRRQITRCVHDQGGAPREIEVHFLPDAGYAPDITQLARVHGSALGLSAHEIQVRQGSHGLFLQMHVEVAPNLSLGEAHDQVTALENNLKDVIPTLREIVTHIEPADRPKTMPTPPPRNILQSAIEHHLKTHHPHVGWHAFQIYPEGSELALTIHAALDSQTRIEAAHHLADAAEAHLRRHFPNLGTITIHTEPFH